ncbi:charged multivesicular body protein 4b-like [Penaeus indicus]|uniref:charged multivesicular body protein 4b-like n=1 Tax=Penaeus chinensis TaxID=139456 RepID=UPI001FB81ACE|nr:charged multivesicular body protein 4b-like [Penaeus chinensis]XP_047469246.1 charged multivesicular body protein 4b-like [Penaeus chinensis]
MSLAKFFGFGKNEKSITPGEAIQKLRDTEEMLCKKQDFLEKKIDQEISLAKQHGSKNKRVALQALKRKKRYEKQLQQIDGTLSTIEMQREALESASTNTTVLQTMNEAAKALRAAHQDMDVDKVHDMMDDIAEQQEVAHEISEAISNPVAFGDGVDEDELLAELEELEQEALDEKLLETTGVTDELPEVPSAIPETVSKKKAKEDYDDDMAELAAWAS